MILVRRILLANSAIYSASISVRGRHRQCAQHTQRNSLCVTLYFASTSLHFVVNATSDTSLCALNNNVLSVSRLRDSVVTSAEWSVTEKGIGGSE